MRSIHAISISSKLSRTALRGSRRRRSDRHGAGCVSSGASRSLVSGGSTLTMQWPVCSRAARQGCQGQAAPDGARVQLEDELSKTISLVFTCGCAVRGNIEASGRRRSPTSAKSRKRLSVGEAALLVALPQSPEARRPTAIAAALRARNRVRSTERSRLVVITARSGIAQRKSRCRKGGVHFRSLRRIFPKAKLPPSAMSPWHRLTLDRELQSALETLASEQTKCSRQAVVGDPGRR